MKKILQFLGTSLFCTLASGCSNMWHGNATSPQSEKPTLQEVSILEDKVIMPKGAFALTEYTRYYAIDADEKRRVIIGLYSRSKTPKIRIVSFNLLPNVVDGGCEIIHIRYDVIDKKMVNIYCGGVA